MDLWCDAVAMAQTARPSWNFAKGPRFLTMVNSRDTRAISLGLLSILKPHRCRHTSRIFLKQPQKRSMFLAGPGGSRHSPAGGTTVAFSIL